MTPLTFKLRQRPGRRRRSPHAEYIKLALMGSLLLVLVLVILKPGLLYDMGLPREQPSATRAAGGRGRTVRVRIITETRPVTRPVESGPSVPTTRGVTPATRAARPETRPAPLPLGIDLAIFNDVVDREDLKAGPYFEALAAVRQLPPRAFTQPGLPEVDLADLIRQPDLYRGRLITVKGNLRRIERQPLGDNPSGLTVVHEGQIRRDQTSFYTCVLIEDPGTGVQAGRDVALTGVFYKIWVYGDRKGTLRQTPLIMGRRLDVAEPLYPEQHRVPAAIGTVVGLALVLLLVLAVLIYRRGDRRFYRRYRAPSADTLSGLEAQARPATDGERNVPEADTAEKAGREDTGDDRHQP